MQKELLKDVIILIVGKQAEDIVNYIDAKRYINEFLIAKKLGITINQLRNILYKLSDEGIVSSIRKKDKRKGWYTYFWKIEVLKALDFLKKILEKRIEQINHQKESRERKNFYICEKCNIEFTEENALLQNFMCSECGDVFTMKDNTRVLRELAKNFDRQKKRLEIIEEEINKEKEKLEKKKIREIKKEKKVAEKKKATKKKASKKTTIETTGKIQKKIKKTKNSKKIVRKNKRLIEVGLKKKVKSKEKPKSTNLRVLKRIKQRK